MAELARFLLIRDHNRVGGEKMMNKKMATMVIGMVLLGTSMVFAAPAFQTTDSDVLNIGGNVPERADITITPVDSESLDLQSVVSDRLIATIVERSNVRAGYTVAVESQNGFTLKGTADDAGRFDTLGYALDYDGEAVTNPGTTFATDTVLTAVHTFAARAARTAGTPGAHTGDTKELKISCDALNVNLYDGDYTDTLTFTITAE
jgi:hypothetical protein